MARALGLWWTSEQDKFAALERRAGRQCMGSGRDPPVVSQVTSRLLAPQDQESMSFLSCSLPEVYTHTTSFL